MKTLAFPLLFSAAALAVSFTGADSPFEGKIVYSISFDGGNMPPEAMAMFEGSSVTTYIKDGKSRTETNMGFQNSTTITDTKAKTSVTLIDMMDNKYKIKNDESTAKRDSSKKDVSVKELDETKEIAGYKCKKYEVSFTDKEGNKQSTVVYATDEIPNQMGYDRRSAQMKALKGMPLEYEMQAQRGMKIKMTAQTVSKESVPDNKFDIPSGYKETTYEDMQKEMMKNWQQH